MKAKKLPKEKAIIARVPFEIWHYLKRSSIDDDTTVSAIINKCLLNYKNKREKSLTNNDSLIK